MISFYVVKSGDTLRSIAKEFYGDPNLWFRIYNKNRGMIPSPDRVIPGTKIAIP